ncbi:hypothetical protein [Spirosoma flavum]|uniref:Uncharacterized protein n=1 Tax=Spirosoma flavum TaxID=2048557 RepID=A0ABW6AP20_9BACT
MKTVFITCIVLGTIINLPVFSMLVRELVGSSAFLKRFTAYWHKTGKKDALAVSIIIIAFFATLKVFCWLHAHGFNNISR